MPQRRHSRLAARAAAPHHLLQSHPEKPLRPFQPAGYARHPLERPPRKHPARPSLRHRRPARRFQLLDARPPHRGLQALRGHPRQSPPQNAGIRIRFRPRPPLRAHGPQNLPRLSRETPQTRKPCRRSRRRLHRRLQRHVRRKSPRFRRRSQAGPGKNRHFRRNPQRNPQPPLVPEKCRPRISHP